MDEQHCRKCQSTIVGSMSLATKLENRIPLKCHWCAAFFCSACVRKDSDCPTSGCTGVLTDYAGSRMRTIFDDGPRYRARAERDEKEREQIEKKAARTRERVDESFSKAKLLARQQKKLAAKRQIQKTHKLILEMRQLIDTHRLRVFTHKSLDSVEEQLEDMKAKL